MTETTRPPNLHPDLLNQPTAKLVREIIHRLGAEPKNTLAICPSEFVDLKCLVTAAQYDE